MVVQPTTVKSADALILKPEEVAVFVNVPQRVGVTTMVAILGKRCGKTNAESISVHTTVFPELAQVGCGN